MPTIVIDNAPLETRSGEHVYSMAEREAAKAYLLEHKDTLNIQAVGFSADKLSVFMNPEATDEDRDAVRNASPVKALEFSNALFGNEGDGKNESPNGNDQGIQGRASDVTLRGGNRIKRTANEKWGWATITISAVRNWDANTKTGDIGLLTCGHGWTDGQDVFASDSTNIGDIDVQLYRNMDAGFILLDNPKLNSHGYMSDGKRITENRAVSEYDVGDAVKKYGAATGSYPLSGKITQTSISGAYWGKDDTEFYFDNLFVIDCINRSGDSGGAVVIGDAILGMVKGAYGVDYDKNTDTYSRTVVMPIRDIMAKTDFLPCK